MVSTNSVKVLETEIQTEERSYEKWRSSISAHNIDPKKYRFLLLPLKDSNLDKCAACTNRRNVTVSLRIYRSPMTTIPYSSLMQSTSSGRNVPHSLSLNYGISCMQFAQLRNRSRQSTVMIAGSETSDQRTFSCLRKERSNWPMNTLGPEKSMGSLNLSRASQHISLQKTLRI